MNLTILTGDFESYYDSEYSLSRMTPVEYICDPRWETIGMSVRVDEIALPMAPPGTPRVWSEKARWLDGPQIPALLSKIDWTRTAFMSHNVGFDGAILKWRYGISPALFIDTLGMCRAVLPAAKGASLDKALAHIGAPPKGKAIQQARGMRLANIKANPAFYQEYTKYANRDCDGCFWLFEHMAHFFAGTRGVGTIHRNEEFALMDMVARMTIEPQMRLNPDLLTSYLRTVKANKATLLEKLADSGVLDPDNPKGDLMSNEKYAQVLRNMGIEPPTKISFKTGKQTYAFAKTDQEFTDLADDEDPIVQALVGARLGFKSTLEETRTERFINISRVQWPKESNIAPHAMPFPLKFSGAHTHRFSGDWSLNLQNLGRKSELRRALVAPPGYVIVSADASQIEARVVAWLAGCTALTSAFAAGLDNYAILAGDVYGYAIDKRTHPGERFVGKTAVLGLGFGMGALKFKVTCRNQGRAQGLSPAMCQIDDAMANKTVNTYRSKYREIPEYWRVMDNVIGALSMRQSMKVGVLYVDGPSQTVILPNGMPLFYENMRKESITGFDGKAKNQWVFDYGRETKYTFGGKMTENCLAGDTMVLTEFGWKRLDNITSERVWDGESWVAHAGLAIQGEQEVVSVDGVYMTHDHEILTTNGWKHGSEADGLDRAEVALPDGAAIRWLGCESAPDVGSALRLRDSDRVVGQRLQQGRTEILRLQTKLSDRTSKLHARHVPASGVCGMALNARPMPSADASGVGQLWRTRNHGGPGVEHIRAVLAGDESRVSARATVGADQQRRGIHSHELSLGDTSRASVESPGHYFARHSVGPDIRCRSSAAKRNQKIDVILPHQARCVPVYDLLNAGPHHRFVVAGKNGPLIVHNCVQAIARIITMNAATRIRRITNESPLAGQIHDQLVYVVRQEVARDHLNVVLAEMKRGLDWFHDLPLDAEGEMGPNLLEAK